MVGGASADEAAAVVIRGADSSADEKRFTRAILDEIRQHAGITDEQLETVAGQDVKTRGPLNWEWVQVILAAVDRYVPRGSAASIALFTQDVYRYLKNQSVRDRIDSGVAAAITPGIETVVVGHSLGSVVAYNLLRRQGVTKGWKVPLFVTVGAPLAITEIRATLRSLATLRCPECASGWFNAMDNRDVVALYPLDSASFPLDPDRPAIENKRDVRNNTSNRHGIGGYLNDQDVAKRIHDALVS